MGLDIVEFVIAVERSFGIDIPDKDAESLETPRLLVEYLAQRLAATSHPDTTCLTQRAFYRARSATARRFGVNQRSLRPQTVLSEVIGSRREKWPELGKDFGSAQWPRLKSENWFLANWGGVSTLGELVRHLAVFDAAAMRDPSAAWTRQEIEALIVGIIESDLGVDMTKYTLDSRFVRDMGLD